MTCAHRRGMGFEYSRCLVTGFFCETERKHATACDINFSRWEPRVTWFARIKHLFIKKS